MYIQCIFLIEVHCWDEVKHGVKYKYGGFAIMLTKAVKWGHSLALRIPKSVAQECGIVESCEIEISCKGKSIVATPVVREYSLDELLAQITPENIHTETDFLKPVGKEKL